MSSLRNAFVAALLAHTAAAQGTIGSRVAQTRDGTVRMEFPARAGVCGDGKEMIGFGHAMFARSFESWGTWHDKRCVPGNVRVSLDMTNGQVTHYRTQVGGSWPSGEGRVSDLGVVSSREASAYFFSLVPKVEQESGKSRSLLPAVLADDAPVIAPLLSLARDQQRTLDTRRQAVQWLGSLGDASVVPALTELARSDRDSENEKKSLVSSALAALSQLPDGVGIPALIELSHASSVTTRRNSAFWLGQSDDARATRRLQQMIEDRSEDDKVRAHAIFSFANGDATSSARFQYLRDLYPKLDSDALKESVIQGMAQDEANGHKWLLARARDDNESTKTRKSALFWLGQAESSRTADLVDVYHDAKDQSLREHAIFVLSQRQDSAATDALIDIAKSDADRKMRGKALFWLAQKHDPRVTKLLTDILSR